MPKFIIPANIQQMSEAVSLAAKQNQPIHIQNQPSSALSVGDGLVLDLTALNRIGPVMGNATSGYVIQAEAGVTYQKLSVQLSAQKLAFASALSNPTTLGGIFCGPSGFALANCVLGITLIQADGTPLTLGRGQCYFDQTGCTLPDGRRLELGSLPNSSNIPCLPAPGRDLLDLFAGSRGTLGIVALLVLQPLPIDSAQLVPQMELEKASQPLSETQRNIITQVRQFFDPYQLLLNNAFTL